VAADPHRSRHHPRQQQHPRPPPYSSAPRRSASANLAQSAPTAGFSVRIETTAVSTQFYVKGTYTTRGIASIAAAGTTGDYTVNFKSPTSLGVGTYQDTVTVEACYDSACSQEVSSSPQTISVTYTVTPGPGTLTSLSPATVQVGVAFTLTVNGSGFDATSVVIFNGNSVPTTFVSATQLTASITASAITQPGPYTVVVAPSPPRPALLFQISSYYRSMHCLRSQGSRPARS
jgi:hypothetical protein